MKRHIKHLLIVVGVALVFFTLCPLAYAWSEEYLLGIDWYNAQGAHSNAGGARADITNYLPRVDYTPGASSAWVMTDYMTNSYPSWLQIGYWRAPEVSGFTNNKVDYFAQYTVNGVILATPYLGTVSNPSDPTVSHRYAVYINPNDGTYHCDIDGVIKEEYTFLFVPNDSEFCGEVDTDLNHYPQMPGDLRSDHHASFLDDSNSIYVYETNSDSWVKVNVNNWAWWPGLPGSRSDHSQNSSSFKIWDTRYSSEGTE